MKTIEFEYVLPNDAHAEIVMEWRNDPETLAQSFNQASKKWESFRQEFISEYFIPSMLPPMFAWEGERRVGFLRFRPYKGAPGRKCLEISIIVAPEARGHGIGSAMLEQVQPLIERAGYDDLFAEVKQGNDRSAHIFEKAGFSRLDQIEKMGGKVYRYVVNFRPLVQGGVFIIAEAGSNWRMGTPERDLAMGKALIEVAAEAGADGVKFQTYRPETVYVENAGQSDYLAESGIKQDISEIFADLAMPYEMIPKLAEHCKTCGIEFMSTPFSLADFEAVDPFVSRHKIASYEISHLRLIEAAAKSGKPTIMSTGASNQEDIAWAVETFRKNGGKDLTLLQCTAKYPAPLSTLHLRVIPWLRERFGVEAGLSDHSRDPITGPCGAVALGAKVIEKHYTLDNRLPGPDHAFALEPDDLKEMCQGIRKMEEGLGSQYKDVDPAEVELSLFARRGMQATRAIEEGDRLEEGVNVDILRPGKQAIGVHPRYLSQLQGKAAKRKIAPGEGIQEGDW